MFINLGNDVAGLPPDYEARLEETFGGLALDRDGLPVPNIMGRLCEWTPPRPPATFASYGDYKAATRHNYHHLPNDNAGSVFQTMIDWLLPGPAEGGVSGDRQPGRVEVQTGLRYAANHVLPEFLGEIPRRANPPARPVSRDSQVARRPVPPPSSALLPRTGPGPSRCPCSRPSSRPRPQKKEVPSQSGWSRVHATVRTFSSPGYPQGRCAG